MFFSTLYNTKNVTTLLLTSNNEHKNLICCIFVYIYVSFYLDTVENTIYNDDGEIFKFTMLSSTLVKHFPSEKLDKLKFLIKSKFSHLYNLKLLIKTKWYFFLLQLRLRLKKMVKLLVSKCGLYGKTKYIKSISIYHKSTGIRGVQHKIIC